MRWSIRERIGGYRKDLDCDRRLVCLAFHFCLETRRKRKIEMGASNKSSFCGSCGSYCGSCGSYGGSYGGSCGSYGGSYDGDQLQIGLQTA